MSDNIATRLLLLAHLADVDLEMRIDIVNKENASNCININ